MRFVTGCKCAERRISAPWSAKPIRTGYRRGDPQQAGPQARHPQAVLLRWDDIDKACIFLPSAALLLVAPLHARIVVGNAKPVGDTVPQRLEPTDAVIVI